MDVEKIKKDLYLYGLAPVVVLDDAEDAVPLAKALYAGGIRFMEITFRTSAAAQSARLLFFSLEGYAGTSSN